MNIKPSIFRLKNIKIEFNCSTLFIVSLLFVFGSFNLAIASDDDYLKALEAEAESIQPDTVVKKTEPTITENIPEIKADKSLISSNQRLEFESSLRQRLPKSYITYQTLALPDKNEVILSYYKSSKKMHIALRTLYKLHFSKK